MENNRESHLAEGGRFLPQRWQKITAGVAGFMILTSLFFGPITYLYEQHQGNVTQRENAQSLAHIENSEAGIKQLLNFVATVQNPSSAGVHEQQWYVAEFLAICTAVHCQGPPLPASLIPPTTTTVPKN